MQIRRGGADWPVKYDGKLPIKGMCIEEGVKCVVGWLFLFTIVKIPNIYW